MYSAKEDNLRQSQRLKGELEGGVRRAGKSVKIAEGKVSALQKDLQQAR